LIVLKQIVMFFLSFWNYNMCFVFKSIKINMIYIERRIILNDLLIQRHIGKGHKTTLLTRCKN
jgi:hypothetical protein